MTEEEKEEKRIMRKTSKIFGLAIVLILAMVLTVPAFAAEKEKVVKTGLVTENGVNHIYSKPGVMVKKVPAYKLKVDGKVCYFSVDKKGVATELTGMMKMAAKRLVSLKAGKKKSIANLKKAFKWSARLRYRNITKKLKGKKAAEYFGKYGFKTKSGDCNVAAYTFYWMAKVLGYKPKVIQGHVPSGSMSNLKNHTWATIKFGKKTYYFDPDFNRAYAGKTVRTRSGMKQLGKYCGFKFLYGTPGTYVYKK